MSSPTIYQGMSWQRTWTASRHIHDPVWGDGLVPDPWPGSVRTLKRSADAHMCAEKNSVPKAFHVANLCKDVILIVTRNLLNTLCVWLIENLWLADWCDGLIHAPRFIYRWTLFPADFSQSTATTFCPHLKCSWYYNGSCCGMWMDWARLKLPLPLHWGWAACNLPRRRHWPHWVYVPSDVYLCVAINHFL
jgi:hypothetical protein